MDELSEEDKLVVGRARRIQFFLSQNFHVAEQFTGMAGSYVPVAETVKGFKDILMELTITFLVAPLKIGALRVNKDDSTEVVAVHGGFIEVRPEVVTILAQSAEKAATIDIARAKLAAQNAEAAIQAKPDPNNLRMAELDLKRAQNRINVYENR